MKPAIRVSHLGKRYTIGALQRRSDTLRDVVAGAWQRWTKPQSRADGGAATSFWALDDVSFEVQPGEVLGVIGRNGAGKSTLLKVLARITEPTTGEVDLRGRVGSLLEVGTGFHSELSGRENVYLNGAILGMQRREIQRKFDEIVDFAGVEKFLDTPVKHYSSGMYMRLAFAVAAHLETEILLVDEVLAVGDAEFQKKCLGKMGEVAQAGRTVLFVSHTMGAIQSLCSTAMVLQRGQLLAYGQATDIISSYLLSAEPSGHSVLSGRSDRQGSGAMRFEALTVLNENGQPVNAMYCGQAAVIRLTYSNSTGKDLRNLHVAVGIDSYLGERIAYLSSELTNGDFSRIAADTRHIDIHIDRLPLMPGRYGCTLFGSVNGIISDWIQHADYFVVEVGDYFKNGRLPPPGQGIFLIDHQFTLGAGA